MMSFLVASYAGAKVQVKDAKIVVSPFDWGPGVDKVVLRLSSAVQGNAISKENIQATTNGVEREVLGVYLSDGQGEVSSKKKSAYITLRLKTSYKTSGSPFRYDAGKTNQNKWRDSYPVEVRVGELNFSGDLIEKRLSPAAEKFSVRGEKRGSYTNPMTGKKDSLVIRYAAYEPKTLKKDGAKNPLVIWLHGQGEGGFDPDITLLGNKVTALAGEKIQSHFTTAGGKKGAYIFVPLTETYWMDGGNGTNSNGDFGSRYTEILMDTIRDYVAKNKDVDPSRIYLGGCSNGGYMTVNMMVSYPDYWAAAYPVCEAYAFNFFARDENGSYIPEISGGNAMGGALKFKSTDDRFFTDEKIEAVKNIPVWFVQSADDSIVLPYQFVLPTYKALLNAGAENSWVSYFDSVKSADDKGTKFIGHWVWVYLLNDEVSGVLDKEAVLAADASFSSIEGNAKGGKEFKSIFAWMNEQKKR